MSQKGNVNLKNAYQLAAEKGIVRGDPDWPVKPKLGPKQERVKKKISDTMCEKAAIRKVNKILENSKSEDNVLKAAKLILDKTVPTLSTVDQTTKDVTETMTEEAMIARLRELVSGNPELLSKILGDNARGKEIKAA